MNDTTVAVRQWYVAKYPALGWVETVIKGAAIGIGLLALVTSLTKGSFVWHTGWRLVEFTVLAILAVGLIAAIYDRVIEREIVAMVFVIFNVLAHLGIVAALVFLPQRTYVFPFCALMAVGDMVKTVFIKAHSFQVRNVPQFMLFALTGAYITGYLVVLIIEMLRRSQPPL